MLQLTQLQRQVANLQQRQASKPDLLSRHPSCEDLSRSSTCIEVDDVKVKDSSSAAGSSGGTSNQPLQSVQPKAAALRTTNSVVMEREVLDVYHHLDKLMQYRELNRTGFRKIMKKWDKLCRDKQQVCGGLPMHVCTSATLLFCFR